MGSHHPAEYFAESILHPNRVIVLGPGYTGADGLSKMPGYEDTMTVKQLVEPGGLSRVPHQRHGGA